MTMLVGINLFEGDEGAMRRQAAACEALLAVEGIEPVNVQFAHGARRTHAALRTLAALLNDSTLATGATGRRKPLTTEVFNLLAGEAAGRGHRYFSYLNSDIVVTRSLFERIADGWKETYSISRWDVNGRGGGKMVTAGQDMFVVSVDWWSRHQARFKPYVIGEACWDNVYTAIMLCHSNGTLLNREPLILHEQHEAPWRDASPTARYNGFLAALDSRYFSLWVRYWHRLEQLRAAGAVPSDEDRLAREVFVWRRSAPDAIRQFVRNARARHRYRQLRAEWTAPVAPR